MHVSVWALPVASIAAIAVLLAAPSWRSAAWHARVPTLFSIAGIVALTGPEQIRHLVAGTESAGQMLAFAVTVLATGVGCWFWARWSLNLAGAGGRSGVFDWEAQPGWVWLPRVVALAPAVGAFIALGQGWGLIPFWRGLILTALTILVSVGLVGVAWGRRRRVMTRRAGQTPGRSVLSRLFMYDEFVDQAAPPGRPLGDWWRLAVQCLPFHPALVAGMAVLFAGLILAVMSGAPAVVPVAQAVGPVPAALLGLAGLLTGLAPPIAFFASARRYPGLLLLGLWVVGSAALSVNTAVVTTEPYPTRRPSFENAAKAWLTQCARPGAQPGDGRLRVMLVGAAGGASRAALWSGVVMQEMERALPMDPAHELFAVSGVSGGALGMAGYVALLDEAKEFCAGPPVTDGAARGAQLQQALGQDFLSPALAGLFFSDGWWRVLGPVSAGLRRVGVVSMERTGWLQQSWDRAFHGALSPTLVQQSLDGPVPRLPLLFTSGTHTPTGRLIVTAPVTGVEGTVCTEPAVSAVPGAIDALQAMCADPTFMVAASNSARFPYVTAPGLLVNSVTHVEYGEVVDGGYYDNLGTTAVQAAEGALTQAFAAIQREGGLPGVRLEVFIVQIWSDPDRLQVPRCGVEPAHEEVRQSSPTALDFLLSPVGALAGVRSERANAGGKAAVDRYCAAAGRHYFAFTMGRDVHGVLAPLNWVLPGDVRMAIATPGLAGFPGMGNEAELARLVAEWGGQRDVRPLSLRERAGVRETSRAE